VSASTNKIPTNVPAMQQGLKNLILDGNRMVGSVNPDELLPFIEERMTARQYRTALTFLKWCQTNSITFGHGTIDLRFHEWMRGLTPVSQDILSAHLLWKQNTAWDEREWKRLGKSNADLPRVGDRVQLCPYGPGVVESVNEDGDLVVVLGTSGPAKPDYVWTKGETRTFYPKSGCVTKL
jgi:hypothetical protein